MPINDVTISTTHTNTHSANTNGVMLDEITDTP